MFNAHVTFMMGQQILHFIHIFQSLLYFLKPPRVIRPDGEKNDHQNYSNVLINRQWIQDKQYVNECMHEWGK